MKFSFCPKCGKPLKDSGIHPVCAACHFVFYQNSKPCVAAILLNDKGQLLLARRAREPHKGKWDLVGGFLEPGEHPEDGLRREVMEETGLEVSIERLLGIFMDTYSEAQDPTLNLCYVVHKTSGHEAPHDDVASLRWFDPDQIPLHEIGFESMRKCLGAFLAQGRGKG